MRVDVAEEVHSGADILPGIEGGFDEVFVFCDWIVCIRADCFSSQGGLYSLDSSKFEGCRDCPVVIKWIDY